MIISSKDYLKHYGVLGMKWGVRKDRKSSRGKRGIGTNNVKNMSNYELQTAIDRMRLEKQYTELVSGPSMSSKTSKFINELGRSSAKQVVSSVVAQQVAQPLNNKINSMKR